MALAGGFAGTCGAAGDGEFSGAAGWGVRCVCRALLEVPFAIGGVNMAEVGIFGDTRDIAARCEFK